MANQDEESDETDERRIPRLTEKGRVYDLERKKTECQSVKKKIYKFMERLEALSCSFEYVHYVQEELPNFVTLRGEFNPHFRSPTGTSKMQLMEPEPSVHARYISCKCSHINLVVLCYQLRMHFSLLVNRVSMSLLS